MIARFRPSSAKGTVSAPPSKSMAHRMLVCAGLSDGESTLRGIAPSQDMLATMDCLRALGADVRYDGSTAVIRGTGGSFPETASLSCRECGSTLRFFVPLALLCGSDVTLTGSRTLFSRPLTVYEDICRTQQLFCEKGQTSLTVRGRLQAGEYAVPGNVSSQFISGLLFALPLLPEDSVIRILPPVESAPYIAMTLQTLRQFGIRVDRTDDCTMHIPGGQIYRAVCADVEGDYSNAAFLDALNLLGGDVTVMGLLPDSLQGDKVYKDHFAQIARGTPVIDLSDCPDLGPVCMAMAALYHGAKFTGTRRLRIKESDRCAAMAAELLRFGVRSDVESDTMTIYADALQTPSQALCGHNDHRIVMAISLLLTRTGGSIEGAEAIQKSFPDFFTVLQTLGIEVNTDNGMDS